MRNIKDRRYKVYAHINKISENLKYSEVAEALLQAYVEGSINVAIETKYKVTPKAL